MFFCQQDLKNIFNNFLTSKLIMLIASLSEVTSPHPLSLFLGLTIGQINSEQSSNENSFRNRQQRSFA